MSDPVINMRLAQVKEMFFDRKKVTNAIDRATRKVLSKFGAYVRTRARSSIRKRRAISEVGQPPSSHNGLLRKNIFFAYDAARKSVVIGPILINDARRAGEAPRLLELGGTRDVTVKGKSGRGKYVLKQFYNARPYMMPAFRTELEKRIPGDFAGEVKE